MCETVRFVLAAVLLLCGVVAGAISILGVFRFHFVMNRMHCAAILDTISMAGILGGLMVATGSMEYIPKLLAALLVLWVGSPIASHLVGRMEIATDETAAEHIKLEEDSHGCD
ncbi:MAG: cation:proton antiporter [Faecousia sp.]